MLIGASQAASIFNNAILDLQASTCDGGANLGLSSAAASPNLGAVPALKMARPTPQPLPEGALLCAYREKGAYTDCFATDVPGSVSHAQFVTAFYTSRLFKVERAILKFLLSKPATDSQIVEMAAGSIDQFSAWRVEARRPDQLLVCDFLGSTRSWLMVAPTIAGDAPATRLFFGSAVVPVLSRKTGKQSLPLTFHLLLGFHRRYAAALLRSAVAQLGTSR
jgi:hypothetical protein